MPQITLSLNERDAESLWFIIDAWLRWDGRGHTARERDAMAAVKELLVNPNRTRTEF